MANPYHNEAGKFCSRGEMVAAIDHAAVNGEITLYLSLRKDFEEAEKGKVLVDVIALADAVAKLDFHEGNKDNKFGNAVWDSKLEASDSASRKVIEDPTTLNYFGSTDPAYVAAINEINNSIGLVYSYHRNSDDDWSNEEEQQDGRITTYFYNYNDENSIPFEKRLEVYNALGDTRYFPYLINDPEEAAELYKQNSQMFFDAFEYFKNKQGSMPRWSEGEILKNIGKNATTSKEIQFVINNADYTFGTIDGLALNSTLTPADANDLLASLTKKGQGQALYWETRQMISNNFNYRYGNKAALPPAPKLNGKEKPIHGGPSDEEVKAYQDQYDAAYKRVAKDDQFNGAAASYAESIVQSQKAILDSYESSYNQLKNNIEPEYTRGHLNYRNAPMYMNRALFSVSIREDYEQLSKILTELDTQITPASA